MDEDNTPKRSPHGRKLILVGVLQGLLLTLLIFLLVFLGL